MKDIKSIICESLDIPESSYSDELEIGVIDTWDSMNHMVLITEIEENFDIELTGDEIAELTSVPKIKEILAAKGVTVE